MLWTNQSIKTFLDLVQKLSSRKGGGAVYRSLGNDELKIKLERVYSHFILHLASIPVCQVSRPPHFFSVSYAPEFMCKFALSCTESLCMIPAYTNHGSTNYFTLSNTGLWSLPTWSSIFICFCKQQLLLAKISQVT